MEGRIVTNQTAQELQETAIKSLDSFGSHAQALKDLAFLVVNRDK